MHSILRFVFVVVPTAALATAVVIGVSRDRGNAAAVVDGDLAQDLELASTAGIELLPADQPLATISSLESSGTSLTAGRARTARAAPTSTRPRAIRSRPRVVREAAAERDVADESRASIAAENDAIGEAGAATVELAGAESEPAEGVAPGGVALPRPTGIPVSFPPPATEPSYDPGPTVTRGGGVFGDDHCQIGGRRGRPVYGPTIFRGPSRPGVRVSDRVRSAEGNGSSRPSVRDRVRASQGGSRSGGGSVADRVRRRG